MDGHEFVKEDDGQLLHWCPHPIRSASPFAAIKTTLVGGWCPSCRRMVDGPYAGQTFDVAPWEVGVLVNDA